MMRSCHVDKAAEAATQDSSSCRQKSSQVCRCAFPGVSYHYRSRVHRCVGVLLQVYQSGTVIEANVIRNQSGL